MNLLFTVQTNVYSIRSIKDQIIKGNPLLNPSYMFELFEGVQKGVPLYLLTILQIDQVTRQTIIKTRIMTFCRNK